MITRHLPALPPSTASAGLEFEHLVVFPADIRKTALNHNRLYTLLPLGKMALSDGFVFFPFFAVSIYLRQLVALF